MLQVCMRAKASPKLWVEIVNSNILTPMDVETSHVLQALGSAGLYVKTPLINLCNSTELPNCELSQHEDT